MVIKKKILILILYFLTSCSSYNQNKKINIQLIFCDGGSTDKTLSLIKDINQKNISKVVLYNLIGMSKALNAGFDVAEGKYLAYLNSDDRIDSETLFKVKNSFEKSSCEWIIGECENIGDKKYSINFLKIKLLSKLKINF